MTKVFNHNYRLLSSSKSDEDDTDCGEDIEMKFLPNGDNSTCKSIENDATDDSKGLKSSFKSLFGLMLAFMSCCFFAVGSLFAKLCKDSLDSNQIVLFRNLIQLYFCMIIITYHRISIWQNFSLKTRCFLAIRGVFGGISLIFIFYAYQNLPLGDASAIIFSSSIYTALLARVLLKEPFGLIDSIILLLTVVGVLLIAQPTALFSRQETENTTVIMQINGTVSNNVSLEMQTKEEANLVLGTYFAILASLMIACSHVALRKLPSVHYTVSLLYPSVIGIFVTSCSLIFTKTFLLPTEVRFWSYLLLIGTCGFIGQMFMIKAYQIENAGTVAVVRQCDIVFAYIFQVTIFFDVPKVASGIGAFLVIGGSLSLAIKKLLKSKKHK